jgi:hypothetical protein
MSEAEESTGAAVPAAVRKYLAKELEAARRYAAPEEPAARVPGSVVALGSLALATLAFFFGIVFGAGRMGETLERVDAGVTEIRGDIREMRGAVQAQEVQLNTTNGEVERLRQDVLELERALKKLEDKWGTEKTYNGRWRDAVDALEMRVWGEVTPKHGGD